MKLPILFQRLEGFVVFAAATSVYFANDLNWIVYLLVLFSFDVFMIGYLINPKIGAVVYNIGHSYIIPGFLAITYLVHENTIVLGLVCLWIAHIGFDRAGGYGLKFTSGFGHTHLGDIGKK